MGGNPSTDPEPPTPTEPTNNQGNTGKDKPDVGGQDKDPDTTAPAAPTEVKAANEEGKTVVTGKTAPNGKVSSPVRLRQMAKCLSMVKR